MAILICGVPDVYCSSTDEWRQQSWEASLMRRWVFYIRRHNISVQLSILLTALIWWMKTVLKQIKWVNYSIMPLHSYFILYCNCIKGSLLHDNLLLLLLLNTYLSQQTRHLAAHALMSQSSEIMDQSSITSLATELGDRHTNTCKR